MDPIGYIFGAVGTVVGALGTYLLKRRTQSGTVNTSDAQTLWQEASAYRQALADRVNDQDQDIKHRDERIRELEQMVRDRDKRISRLEAIVNELTRKRVR